MIRSPISSCIRGAVTSSLGTGGGYTFTNAEAAALVARFTTPPDSTRKGHIDTLVGALRTAGVWSKLDALYVTAAADAQAAQRNWIADAYNLTPVNSPTFTADRGYAGNGSSSYINTGLTLSSASKFVQDSASLGIWCRTDSSANQLEAGARISVSSRQSLLSARNASGVAEGRINRDISETGIAVASSVGLLVATRTSSTLTTLYKNGSSIGTYSNTSVVPAPHELYLLAANTAGTANVFSSRQVSVAWAGGGLTGSENVAIYNALNTYLTAVGAA